MSRLAWLWARLPTGSEAETARDGVLSSRPELHALVVGLLAGALFIATDEAAIAVAFATVVFGARRMTGHLADARHEAAYTGAGFLLAMGVGVIV